MQGALNLHEQGTSYTSIQGRIKMISAREKYDKIGFIRMLAELYSENKCLRYDIAKGYEAMAHINLQCAADGGDVTDEYEKYIVNLNEETAKTINEEYKRERSCSLARCYEQ